MRLLRRAFGRLTLPALVILACAAVLAYHDELSESFLRFWGWCLGHPVELWEALVWSAGAVITIWAVLVVMSINFKAEWMAADVVRAHRVDMFRAHDATPHLPPGNPMRSQLQREIAAKLRLKFFEPENDRATRLAAHMEAQEIVRRMTEGRGSRWHDLRDTHAEAHITWAVNSLFIPTDDHLAAASAARSYYASSRRRKMRGEEADFREILANGFLWLRERVLSLRHACYCTDIAASVTSQSEMSQASTSGQSERGSADDQSA